MQFTNYNCVHNKGTTNKMIKPFQTTKEKLWILFSTKLCICVVAKQKHFIACESS